MVAFSKFVTALFLSVVVALPQGERANEPVYDVIVVGAGASGIIAATRFAEAGIKTLLVESGGPFFARDGGQAIRDWQREIDPNTNITRHDGMGFFSNNLPTGPGASAFYDTSVPALAPKGVGGGTGVNGAQQFWPPRRYLDNAFGFPGWTADDFQPALRRVERRIPTTAAISADGKFYGDEVYEVMRPVFEGLGFAEVDTNVNVDAKYNTFGRDIFAVKDGLRGGPVVGYLQDAKRLPNFTLMMWSRVDAVIRDPSNPALATGVQVNGTTITGRNVVLAAGAWNTPTLMFRSGIGPREELITALATEYTTVPENQWVVNPGVGRNMHDHPTTGVTITYNDTAALPNNDLSGLWNGTIPRQDAEDLLLRRIGRLTNFGRQQAAWLPVQDPASPDLEMIVQIICSTPTTTAGSFQCQFNLNEGTLSRGGITIQSNGTIGPLVGRGPWLNDEQGKDLELYIIAIEKFVNAIRSTPGFNVTTPANNVTSRDGFRQYLLNTAVRTNNHWGGSCSVAATADAGCADLNGKVYGTDNLFVIDGSLTPAPTTSNSAYLYEGVAELVSDKIVRLLRPGVF
ncbi:GMC oxidoreductase-like protein 6 [Elsinoe australis]|uniref:GMC oxidoreductase-like protein 6 n=1 Tax=Elsinoe australis TaxID=40998 RepID=A0A4U7B6K7_9PEZI|nr:GMC oxidoreductase-like protein 6 [Elsinoe australis]